MVTPLLDRDTLDEPGLQRLVEHILQGGVHGLFILGTTGEAPALSYRLRRQVVTRVCRQVGARVPVLVGITDTSFVESVELANAAKAAGASAVVLAPPFYFPAGQPELIEYLEHLAPQLPLPLFLYNAPAFTKVTFEPDTVRRAAELPNVLGLKDSSKNMLYFHQLQELLADRPGFSLMIGIEEMLAEAVLMGAHGAVPGGANLFPRLYVDLYEAARARQIDRMLELHDKVMQVSNRVYTVGKHTSSYLKGVKCVLSLLGVCSDFMAEPFHHFRPPERAVMQAHLDELKKLGVG